MSGFYNIEGSPLGDGCCRRYGKCPQGQTCGSGCKCSRGVDMREYDNDRYSNHPGLLNWLFPIPAALSNYSDNKKMEKWRSEQSGINKTSQQKLDASALEKSNIIREEKEQLRLEEEAYRLSLTAEDAQNIEYKRKKQITKTAIFVGVPILIVIAMVWFTYSNKNKK